jgi:hypothetical protein
MIPVETIPGIRAEIRRMVEEVNSSVIYLLYCKNFSNATKHPG